MRNVLLAAVAVALSVAVGGTVLGGRFCTGPDHDGCEDRLTRDGESDGVAFDADWYGWPVKWKTDMSRAKFENKGQAGPLLIDRWGVSWVLLSVSLSVWFAAALVPEGLALAAYGRWRRTKRVRQSPRAVVSGG